MGSVFSSFILFIYCFVLQRINKINIKLDIPKNRKKKHSKGILNFREDFCALAKTVYLSDVCKIKAIYQVDERTINCAYIIICTRLHSSDN